MGSDQRKLVLEAALAAFFLLVHTLAPKRRAIRGCSWDEHTIMGR
jgi:hypothetical protein